jgi:hypothetical protein
MVNSVLSKPVYALPMKADGLAMIGKITLIWGQIDSQVDGILITLGKFNREQYDHLFGYKTIGPKLQALRVFARVADEPIRGLVTDMCEAVSDCSAKRNLMTHGLWGWEYEKEENLYHSCAWSRSKNKMFYLSEIEGLYERAIEAGLKTDATWYRVMMNQSPPEGRNRLMMFGDGPPLANQLLPPRYED